MPMLVCLLMVLGWWGPARAPYAWPLSPARVVRGFDPPARPWLPGHRGVDLAGTLGEVVRSAGAGRIAYAGVLAGRGVVSVAHPGGLRTTYEPVTPSVRMGDEVGVGSVLGTLDAGHPGCPVAACLHWGLLRGEVYLDPLALLGLGRVRLLPTAAPPAPTLPGVGIWAKPAAATSHSGGWFPRWRLVPAVAAGSRGGGWFPRWRLAPAVTAGSRSDGWFPRWRLASACLWCGELGLAGGPYFTRRLSGGRS